MLRQGKEHHASAEMPPERTKHKQAAARAVSLAGKTTGRDDMSDRIRQRYNPLYAIKSL